MWFKHYPHIQMSACCIFEGLNNILICQQIHLKPDRFLRAIDSIEDDLLTCIRFDEDTNGLWQGSRCGSRCWRGSDASRWSYAWGWRGSDDEGGRGFGSAGCYRCDSGRWFTMT